MLQKYYIPTYEKSLKLVETKQGLTFYESIQYVDGYKISVFNYRLATYEDFVENNAFELRGLVYVFNTDNTVYKSYRLLHKFFNLNQVPSTQYDLIKDYEIQSVSLKEDGSIISFIQLPNGKILAKSKMSILDNTQSKMAQKLYEKNSHIKALVDYTIENDLVAIFELVSPFNKVVLDYTETELILLKLRDNKTGNYLPFDVLYNLINNIKKAEPLKIYNWIDMLSLVDTIENIEGWVVDNGNDFIKLKTKWYCDRHNLITDYINRPDFLIEKVLNEEIDDVLGILTDNDIEVKALIDLVIYKVNKYLSDTIKDVNNKVDEYYLKYNNGKNFYLDNKNHIHITIIMTIINTNRKYEAFDLIKKLMLERTYRLGQANYFLRNEKLLSLRV